MQSSAAQKGTRCTWQAGPEGCPSVHTLAQPPMQTRRTRVGKHCSMTRTTEPHAKHPELRQQQRQHSAPCCLFYRPLGNAAAKETASQALVLHTSSGACFACGKAWHCSRRRGLLCINCQVQSGAPTVSNNRE